MFRGVRVILLSLMMMATLDGAAQRRELLNGGEMGSKWIVEAVSDQTLISVEGDTMEVVNPSGLTLWYDKMLEGDYQIGYRVKFIMEGGEHDRLSDLNCFWGAIDPQYPDNIYERSEWRGGMFGNYNTMDLFYVGYGGNKNRTTRFRRYRAEFNNEVDKDKMRPVIKEYLDPEDLLKPNIWMSVVIRVEGDVTTYSMDGKELFRHTMEQGQDRGYFGLRLLRNHTIFTGFYVKEL